MRHVKTELLAGYRVFGTKRRNFKFKRIFLQYFVNVSLSATFFRTE